jgi:hypothetical protein
LTPLFVKACITQCPSRLPFGQVHRHLGGRFLHEYENSNHSHESFRVLILCDLALTLGEVRNNGQSGLCRLVDEAFSAGVPVAVCSTSNEKAVSAIVRVLLGAERATTIRIFAGDVVPKKKPDPAIYNLAAGELNVDASRYVPRQLKAVLPLTVRLVGICNLYLV